MCVCVCAVQLLSHVQLFDLMDYSPPDSSVHVIFQARIREWVSISENILNDVEEKMSEAWSLASRKLFLEGRQNIDMWKYNSQVTERHTGRLLKDRIGKDLSLEGACSLTQERQQ